jgi:hypothetical protein
MTPEPAIAPGISSPARATVYRQIMDLYDVVGVCGHLVGSAARVA